MAGDDLDEIDRELMKHLANYPDATLAELGRHAKIPPSTVRSRMKRPAFRRFLRMLAESTDEIIVRAQREAAQKLVKLTRSANERVALDACRILLNPLLNKSTTEHRFTKETIFRSQIGQQGQLMQEVIDIAIDDDAAKKAAARPMLGGGGLQIVPPMADEADAAEPDEPEPDEEAADEVPD